MWWELHDKERVFVGHVVDEMLVLWAAREKNFYCAASMTSKHPSHLSSCPGRQFVSNMEKLARVAWFIDLTKYFWNIDGE